MAALYPGALDSFVPKSDGPAQKIMAAHVNDLQNAVVAVETELGTDPAGSLVNLKTRLAVMLTAAGGLIGPERIRTVAKSGASYTTITSAIASISDATANKIYTVLVFPGEYDEAITLKNYVDIVAVDPESAKILRQVTDNNVECHCYLNITIESASGHGLYIRNFNSVVTIDGNISSSVGYGIYCFNSCSITINGNVSSTASYGVYCSDESIITINGNISSTADYGVFCRNASITINGNVFSTFNASAGHGVVIDLGTVILQNCKIVCTHADAKSIYATYAENVRCMSVWANRDDDINITQLIAGGFTFDADVQ